MSRPRRPHYPTVIAKVPFQYAGDGRHREPDERALVRVETLARFDQPNACHLNQIVIVLAAMCEAPCQGFREPQMGGDHFVEDPLSFGGSGCFGLREEVMGPLHELFAGARGGGGFGKRHARATLRQQTTGVARFSATF